MRRALTLLCIVMISLASSAREVIDMRERGIVPDSGEDITPAVIALLEELGNNPRPVELRFEKGRYDFWSDNAGEFGNNKVLFLFNGLDSLWFNGGGATFIGHGVVSFIGAVSCNDLTISDYTLDWDRTLISQGVFKACGKDWVDVEFDPEEYPFEVSDGKAWFIGENWKRDVCERSFSTMFDPATGDVWPGANDEWLSWKNELYRGKAEQIDEKTIRFYGQMRNEVPLGAVIALYNGVYLGTAMALADGRNAEVRNVYIYHSMGMGLTGERVENILVDNFNTCIRRDRGRYFSMVSDGIHFNTCRGEIEIRNCSFEGQGDDCLNIHGRYHRIDRVSRSRRAAFFGSKWGLVNCPKPGDRMWLVDNETVGRVDTLTVKKVRVINDTLAKIRFKGKIDRRIGKDDFLENASWYPNVKFHDNRCLHSNRARGILLTPAGKAEVYNNYFSTGGASILVEGDISYWFESGSVHGLDIHDNVFENCGTCCNSPLAPSWGEAPVCISPSHRPASVDDPCYHHDIRIHDNVFRIWDEPILFARSVQGLQFRNNTVERSDYNAPKLIRRANITLHGCKDLDLDPSFTVEDIMNKE